MTHSTPSDISCDSRKSDGGLFKTTVTGSPYREALAWDISKHGPGEGGPTAGFINGTIGMIVDASDPDYATVLIGETVYWMHWSNISKIRGVTPQDISCDSKNGIFGR